MCGPKLGNVSTIENFTLTKCYLEFISKGKIALFLI